MCKEWERPLSKRKLLNAHIRNNGTIYLESQYYSDNWLFHTQISIKIGDVVLRSEDIPSYSKLNVRDHTSGIIWEIVSYTGGKDNGILKAIYDSKKDDEIKVRFIGREYYSEVVLGRSDITALKESYELSEILKRLIKSMN